jgi:hypothetical protein
MWSGTWNDERGNIMDKPKTLEAREIARRERNYLFQNTSDIVKPIGRILSISDSEESNTTTITIEVPKQMVRTAIVGEIYRLEIIQDRETIQEEIVDSLYPDLTEKINKGVLEVWNLFKRKINFV